MKKPWIIAILCLAFSTVQAQEISKWKIENLDQYIRESEGILVINFWATFCKPCVAEIPGFIATVAKQKEKVRLLLVSLDMRNAYPQKLKNFLTEKKWKGQFIWLDETNADHFCPMIDSSWSGAIPATVVINKARGYKKFWEGELREEVLNKEIIHIAALQKQNGFAGRFSYPMNDVSGALFQDDFMHAATFVRFDGATVFSEDSTVYALAGGVVQTVLDIDEMTMVMIKKDDFYFTYSNLKNTRLKKNDYVQANTIIGFAGKNLDGKTAVDIYLSTANGNITLRKNNFVARNHPDYYSLPPASLEPE